MSCGASAARSSAVAAARYKRLRRSAASRRARLCVAKGDAGDGPGAGYAPAGTSRSEIELMQYR